MVPVFTAEIMTKIGMYKALWKEKVFGEVHRVIDVGNSPESSSKEKQPLIKSGKHR